MKGVAKAVSAEALQHALNSLYKHFGLVFVLALVLLPSTIIIISQRKRGAQTSTRNSIPCFVGASCSTPLCLCPFLCDGWEAAIFYACIASRLGEKQELIPGVC